MWSVLHTGLRSDPSGRRRGMASGVSLHHYPEEAVSDDPSIPEHTFYFAPNEVCEECGKSAAEIARELAETLEAERQYTTRLRGQLRVARTIVEAYIPEPRDKLQDATVIRFMEETK